MSIRVSSFYGSPDNNGTIYNVEREDGACNDVKILDTGMAYVMEPYSGDINRNAAILAAASYEAFNDLVSGVDTDETEYGEERHWITLRNGRSIEVTHEENGLPQDKQYWSLRLHCSNDEFDANKFWGTMGIISQEFINAIEGTKNTLKAIKNIAKAN